MKLVRGKEYRVLSDSFGCFRPGDIVVALEEDGVSFFIERESYEEGIFDPEHYPKHTYHPLMDNEVEELEDETYVDTERKKCEDMIVEKLKEINDIVHDYFPGNDWLMATISGDIISFNNDYWNDGRKKLSNTLTIGGN